ncbi:MAG: Cu(I)/Ag(I) efflux system membrane fusion protein [Vicingaceae bacterium]|jgi:Cu(I)/Ag(I) efflux system membrane fusion protein
MKKLIQNKWLLIVLTLIVGGLIGWLIKPSNQTIIPSDNQTIKQSDNQIWTCSMHPQIRKAEAGNCPICGMELIPLASEEDLEADPNAIKMSPTAMQLANVQTAIVRLGSATKELNLTGKISADERRVYTQTAHIAGRVEHLNVNFEGETVKKGQVIGSLYSPELITAQEELFIAVQNQESQPQLLTAAQNKLKNWKLTDQQINQLIKSGVATDEFSVLADYSGVVLDLQVEKGDYLKEGQAFYEVADLSELWVLLDIHESDLSWIDIGDTVSFTVKALPNQSFSGKVSFIDPIINPKTRVAEARIEIDNTNGKLKPQMLVNARVKSLLSSTTEEIIVPKSAVMWTGDRSVVYVKQTSNSSLYFTMREVDLGASLGDTYIINNGLVEGEEIAVNGTFSIDAAAQLAGKPSMMNPDGGIMNTGHNHGGESMGVNESSMELTNPRKMNNQKVKINNQAKKALVPVFENYFNLKNALTQDNFTLAQKESEAMTSSLNSVKMSLFNGEGHTIWMKMQDDLKFNLKRTNGSKDIEQIRESFIQLSNTIIQLHETFEPLEFPVYVQHCPMANNNNGADWLSKEKEIINPYFGSMMLNCGELK